MLNLKKIANQHLFKIFFCINIFTTLNPLASRPNIVAEVPTLDVGPLVYQTVMAGGTASLSCPKNPLDSSDTARLVLWYKNDTSRPFMSYDSRDANTEDTVFDVKRGFVWRSGLRSARITLAKEGTTLVIRRTFSGDQAEYRCTVHYRHSPSITRRIQLIVNEKIEKLFMETTSGESVGRHVGPLSEGQRLRLNCRAFFSGELKGIEWYLDEQVVGSSWSVLKTGEAISHLDMMMEKSYAGKVIRCRLLTFDSTLYAKKDQFKTYRLYHSNMTDITTSILMNYIPDARLLVRTPGQATFKEEKNKSSSIRVTEGHIVIFTCSIRARPPPYNVTWLFNGRFIDLGLRHKLEDNASLLVSPVSRSDRGIYTCVASNSEGDGQSNAVFLHVDHSPYCVGPETHNLVVARNKTITLSCKVDASPENVSFIWVKDTSEEEDNNETRDAKNSAEQNFFFLEDYKQNLVTQLTSFKKSVLPHSQVPKEPTRSLLTITPTAGVIHLFCYAKNTIGYIQIPCSYKLAVIDPPHSPTDCRADVLEQTRLHVTCSSKFSQQQNFRKLTKQDPGLGFVRSQDLRALVHLEVWSNYTLLVNVSGDVPDFTIRGLPQDSDLRVKIYSASPHASSERVTMSAHTGKHVQEFLEMTENQAQETNITVATPKKALPHSNISSLAGVVGGLLGGVGGSIFILIAAIAAIKQRHKKRRRLELALDPTSDSGSVMISEGPLRSKSISQLPEEEALNPKDASVPGCSQWVDIKDVNPSLSSGTKTMRHVSFRRLSASEVSTNESYEVLISSNRCLSET